MIRVATGVVAGVAALTAFLVYYKQEGGVWHSVSWLIGWSYFIAWSLSFYPQLVLNYKKQSTEGLSFNFVWLNLLGFFCYSVFNCAFYFSDSVQESYEVKNHGEKNLVKLNDVFFALHATVLTAATVVQMYICGLRRSPGRQTWLIVRAFIVGAVTVSSLYLIAVFAHGNPIWNESGDNFWTMLQWLYAVSYIKLFISFVKYCPQVYLNFKRKSTVGWSLHNVLLDFTGGLLSLAQLLIDASLSSNWSGVVGNPVKFGLALISLVFDIIFLVQHYVLYADVAYTEFSDEEAENELLS